MTVLFNANLEIIKQRWPLLGQALSTISVLDLNAHLVQGTEQTISVNGIQLSSRHNRIAEAQLLISQLPSNSSEATIYGVGMGDVPTILVQKSAIKHIRIYLLNLNLFALLLTYTDQREWLSDQRLELEYQLQHHRLAQKYIAITPELSLSSDENARLRDLIVFNNNLSYANKSHDNIDVKLKQRMIENLATTKKDSDAADLSSHYQPTKTLVIATGPTLELHYAYLKIQRALPESTRPLMISVDTALKALLNENIIPDIVVSIDQNISRQLLPDNIPTSRK